MNIDIVGGIKNRGIKDSMSLECLVDYIRNPDIPHLEKVNLARSCGKGTPQYEFIKKNQIPCAILNFTHSKGYVSGGTVHKPTGYLYIDVDGTLDIDLTNQHIAAYWKSLSGTGYSIVVAVKGLTKKNVKSATREVASILDVPFDPSAVSVDRLTCISYDPNAYFNSDAEVYCIQSTSDEKVQTSLKYNTLTMGLRMDCTFREIRVNNLDDILRGLDFNGEPMYDFGVAGVWYADVHYSIWGVPEGSRNKVMYSTVCQLRSLNPWCSEERMYQYVSGLNRNAFRPPLSTKELRDIVSNAYKGKLPKVTLNKWRRFVYNTDYDLTTSQKRSIVISHINKKTYEDNTAKIIDTIQTWNFKANGKITMSGIAGVSGLSLRTIKSRSGEIKEKIKQKNLAYKKSSN